MKKILLRIILISLLATLICQTGTALTCLDSRSVMHMPSAKNTVVVLLISVLMTCGAEIMWNKICPFAPKTAAVVLVLGVFLLAVVVASLLHPLTDIDGKVAYRYPVLAAIASGALSGELAVRKVRPSLHGLIVLPDFSLPETVYTATLIVLGLIVCAVFPRTTMTGIDDETHYMNTLYYSEGIYSAFDEGDIALFYVWDESVAERETQNHIYIDSDAFFWTPTRVGYIGPAMGLWTGLLLQLDTGGRLLCGRIGGLLLYAVITYYAIHRLKNGKHLLGLVCLAPISVQYAVTCSYDAWLLAFSALGLSYFFGAIQRPEEPLSDRECLIMTGALFIGTWPKMPYAVLLLILLLMPSYKFADGRQRKKYYLMVVFCIALEFVFTMLASFGAGDVADARGGEDISGYGQVIYILSHSAEFADMMGKHLISYLKPMDNAYLTTWFYFGSTPTYVLLMAGMLLAAMTDNQCAGRYVITRIFGLLVLLILVIVISLSMYLAFTPVGADSIAGVQPRYKLQLLFPFFMLMISGWFVFPKKHPQLYNLSFYVLSAGTLLYNMVVLL